MNKLSSIKFKGEEGAKSLYFTSDTHFFHKNVIKYCDRRGDKNPFDRFESAQEMNEHMVEVWNKKVPKDAVVFHLGDFSVGCKDKKALSELIHSLNGRIYLAKGNHESDVTKNPHIASLFEDIRDRYEIYVDDDEISYGKQHIVMSHYPMLAWNASHRGSWQLFGHVHGGMSNKGRLSPTQPSQLDVGVDVWGYKPL